MQHAKHDDSVRLYPFYSRYPTTLPILVLIKEVISHMIKPYVKGYTTKNVLDHIHTKYLSIVGKPKSDS